MSQTTVGSSSAVRELLDYIASASGLPKEEVNTMYEKARNGAGMAELCGIPKESLEAGYSLAYSFYTTGNYADAETMFRTLSLYDENNPSNWSGLGLCLEKRQMYREAAICFAHACDLANPLLPKSLYLLADVCHKYKDDQAATLILQKAIALEGDFDADQQRYQNLCRDLLALLSQE